jgi:hypothetical protein
MIMIRFKEYITEDKKMTPMTPKEWLKYDWRIEVFLRKYRDKEIFELANGKKMIFEYNKAVEKDVTSRDQGKISKLRLVGATDGKLYKMSDIGKSQEFGGKGSGASTVKEDQELKSLRDQLNKIKSDISMPNVPIKIGTKVYKVYDVESTPGTPKSDFHLLDSNAREIVWISHKDGKGPKDFQQWGGISQRSEPDIFRHPEVQAFIKDLKEKYPDGLPRATTLYRKIKDNKLKKMSVYGNKYGQNLGRQNVSIMIQGPVKLKMSGSSYEFVSNHVHLNGEDMTGGFEPVLTAIYKGDRSDAGVKGTRIVIMPIEGRKMTGEF